MKTLSEIIRENVEKDLGAVSIELCGGSNKLPRDEYNELYTDFQNSQIALIEGMIERENLELQTIKISENTELQEVWNSAKQDSISYLQEQLSIIKEIK